MNAAQQGDLFAGEGKAGLPEGLTYADGFLDGREEAELARLVAGMPLEPFAFHGFTGKRRVTSFGFRYDFTGERLRPAGDMPEALLPLRDRAADFANVARADVAHVLVTEYEAGAPIGWHRDRPEFGVVIGVSLLSACVFRLRRRTATGFERASFIAAPRSIYVLRGPARHQWEHSIPPVEALRYSLTFRTLR